MKTQNFAITTSLQRLQKDMDLSCFMYEALQEAEQARKEGEVPIGAIVVGHSQEIVARDHNRCISHCDPTAHAEILAIRQASKILDNYRLNHTTLFITIEPCLMCMGAILNARIERLVFGAFDQKFGASGLINKVVDDKKMYHKVQIIPGIMEDACKRIMQDFFKERR